MTIALGIERMQDPRDGVGLGGAHRKPPPSASDLTRAFFGASTSSAPMTIGVLALSTATPGREVDEDVDPFSSNCS